MIKLKLLWSNRRVTFWFMPSLIVAGSIVLAMALIEADATRSKGWLAEWSRLVGAGAKRSEDNRSYLIM